MGVVRGEHSCMAYRISTAGPTVYGFRRADSKSLNREPFGMEALSKVYSEWYAVFKCGKQFF